MPQKYTKTNSLKVRHVICYDLLNSQGVRWVVAANFNCCCTNLNIFSFFRVSHSLSLLFNFQGFYVLFAFHFLSYSLVACLLRSYEPESVGKAFHIINYSECEKMPNTNLTRSAEKILVARRYCSFLLCDKGPF